MRKEETWRGDVKTVMQIKRKSVKRKRDPNECVKKEKERQIRNNEKEERQTRECGMSGADKSRHTLRWEDHHGDELN